jgi:hypothetical protein
MNDAATLSGGARDDDGHFGPNPSAERTNLGLAATRLN